MKQAALSLTACVHNSVPPSTLFRLTDMKVKLTSKLENQNPQMFIEHIEATLRFFGRNDFAVEEIPPVFCTIHIRTIRGFPLYILTKTLLQA